MFAMRTRNKFNPRYSILMYGYLGATTVFSFFGNRFFTAFNLDFVYLTVFFIIYIELFKIFNKE